MGNNEAIGRVGGERAVSPVIGVILMVAITVILAAVIGVFVLGLGDAVQETPPNVQLDDDWDGDNLTITHSSGDTLDSSTLLLTGPSDTVEFTNNSEWDPDWTDEIRAGSSSTINTSNLSVSSGDTLRVVWESGGSSSTIKQIEVP